MNKILLKPNQDSKGSGPLKKDVKLYSDTVEKANIFNNQFQSVFTPKSPLKLSQLAHMTVHDLSDRGAIYPSQVPGEILSSTPQMERISVFLNDIVKLLKDLNPFKAAEPAQIRPLVLVRLCDVIANIIQVIFHGPLTPGGYRRIGVQPLCAPFSKREISALLQAVGPFH